MTHKQHFAQSKKQLGVLCLCGHGKAAHGVKKQTCITCDCRKYRERKRTYR